MGPAATPALQEAAPPRAPALRVAVATRGGLIAESVAALLREHGLDATLHQAQGTVRWTAQTAPHAVVLLDELGPLLEPTIVAARRDAAGVRIVLLARLADAAAVGGAVELGVHGLVDAEAPGHELAQAVRDVVAGRRILPALTAVDGGAAKVALSSRQLDVLRLVAHGLSNQEIAAELVISVNTVKFHVRTIFRQLGIHNRVEAARVWAEAPPRASGRRG